MSEQRDIDDHLPVTRTEMREIARLLTSFTQHAVLLTLHAGSGEDEKWRSEMAEMQTIQGKIEDVLSGARSDV